MVLEIGSFLASRYEIIEKIGAGGMAIVYKAKDNKLGRYVALKVLREEFVADAEFITRFRTEAQSAAMLSHPNIVNVFDVGQEGSIYYIVMELVTGETLKDLILEKAPFDERAALAVAMQVASALLVAHQHNIVHRDIKPQNILVKPDGTVKVADFGIARAAASTTLASASSAIGSVHYFSPEQARGGYIDFKSDIYSLGIVMFEMVTGKLPYEGDSSVSIALKHLNDELPSVSTYVADASSGIDNIIQRACRKNSTERYDSMEEFLADLRALHEGKEVKTVNFESLDESQTRKLSAEELKAIQGGHKSSGREKTGGEPDRAREDMKRQERKVVFAAIGTAVFIILIISAVGYNLVLKDVFGKVEVPQLIGLTVEAAQELLEERELRLDSPVENFNDEYEPGLIYRQSKDAGTEVKRGETLSVYVSKGSNKTTVPSVVNDSESEAVGKLDDANLKFTKSYEFSDDVPIDIVFDQSPPAGELVDLNTAVTIIISKGPDIKKVIVPTLTGFSEAAAKRMIEDAGLTTGSISYMDSDRYEKGVVMGQTVSAGTEVNQKSIVGIVVSNGSPATEEPDPPAQTLTSKKFTVNPLNLPEEESTVQVRVIRILPGASEGEVVYNQSHEVSEFPFEIDVAGEGRTTFQLYINDNLQYPETIEFS